ncbi:tripartite tricarboxylate transporter TctB family protein [Nocardioides jensenii]|uniref:tripartite tricarboxylate transporter TctB family protein n=1 Tax=Nocardioides jensenii TaxID=1843 RepID=UPI0012F7E22A|nr:tripartite tricarboxylate transporter TctB family protein [Nocardioides jensenii]
MDTVMPEAQSDQQGDQTPGGWRAHIFRLAPLVLTLFAAYAIYQARDLEIRSLSEPGPGMWPLIVSSVMGISSLLLIVRDIPEDYEPWSLRSARVLGGIAVLAAFVWFFDVLGFVPSAFLILFIWMKVLAHESWRLSLLLAVAGAFSLNYIFVDVFAVPFPPGLVVITSGG